MTTVLMKKVEDKVFVACDTQVTCSGLTQNIDSKVFIHEYNEKLIFGCAGDLIILQNIKYGEIPAFSYSNENNKIEKYFINDFIPFLKDLLEDEEDIDLLISYEGRIFNLDKEGFVEIQDHFAIGSGGEIAIGALEAGCDPCNAIRIASKYDVYTNNRIIGELF